MGMGSLKRRMRWHRSSWGGPDPTGLVSREEETRPARWDHQPQGEGSGRSRPRQDAGMNGGPRPGLRTSRGIPGRQSRDPLGLGSWAEPGAPGPRPTGRGGADGDREDPRRGVLRQKQYRARDTGAGRSLGAALGAGRSGEDTSAGLTRQSGRRRAARLVQSRTQAASRAGRGRGGAARGARAGGGGLAPRGTGPRGRRGGRRGTRWGF